MSEKLSFADMEGEAAEVAVAEKTELVTNAAPSKGNLLPAVSEQMADSGVSGEFTSNDILPPRLNLVAKTSGLVDEGFTPGQIVFQKELALVNKDRPLNVTVLSLRKGYQEEVDYDTGGMPRRFDTLDDVHANGGSTEWGSDNMYRPVADFVLLVEAPDDLPEEGLELFPFNFEDKSYALAALTAAKTSYNTSAKPVAQAAMYLQGAGIWTVGWIMKSLEKSNGKNVWYVPKFDRAGKHSEKFLEFVESIKP